MAGSIFSFSSKGYTPTFSTSSPPSDTSLVNVSNTHLMATRAKASVRKPNPKYAHHVLVSTDDYFELTSFSQANKLKEWRLAMADEFNALLCARTWTLVPHTLAMNVLPNKWVFLFNRNSDGTIQHYKARFVTNGFHQQPGLDYGETFSPVANNSTILLILALSVQLVGMFAPRAWFHVSLLTYFRWILLLLSPIRLSLCTLAQGSIHIYLLIYVDDILVTGSDLSRITTLISDLGRRFSMKDLVSAHYFLGMELLHTRSGFSLTQTKYVVDLLMRVNMHKSKPMPASAISGRRLSISNGDPLPDPTECGSTVGALQYLTLTRSDISFAVNQVCQFMHINPLLLTGSLSKVSFII
ncbi:hypothetical protein L3X38_004686 [Prunus dulcis]|uniref:Reverse transcriptase Ty1/copia-type domain-containing protein n=1 Tax=Prunus dulcis TaxID=3755 RepID=A0AAD4ZPG5_PRUDU|nr:hypothetical protein L3X38_004686 [Prunus dulcis]